MRGSKNFCQGGGGWGGGVSKSDCQKTDLTTFVILFLVLVLNLLFLQFYSGLSIVYFKEDYNFPRGSYIFQGGGGGLTLSREGGGG